MGCVANVMACVGKENRARKASSHRSFEAFVGNEQTVSAQDDSGKSDSDLTMDQLRLFVSLRALGEGGGQDPAALQMVHDDLARLESELAVAGEAPEPFRLDQEDLDNLFLLKVRQSLEPEGKIKYLAPVRWLYSIFRRLFFGTQRRYNESATYLVRRLYSTALRTRYYQLRSLVLERRLKAIEMRLALLESTAGRPTVKPSSPPSESGRED